MRAMSGSAKWLLNSVTNTKAGAPTSATNCVTKLWLNGMARRRHM